MLINGVPLECVNQAAVQYHVPARLIVAVLKTENGKVGQVKKNHNGTCDYGPMQINSIWLQKIKKYGYTAHDLQYDPCANVAVGTWILARNIASGNDIWQGIGDYHSHTTNKNVDYQHRVNVTYDFIQRVLAGVQ